MWTSARPRTTNGHPSPRRSHRSGACPGEGPDWPCSQRRRVITMSIKLTDTQLVMLSATAQRQDRCIAAPPSLKGAAAHKIATKLVTAGLVEEIKAKRGRARVAARRYDRRGLRSKVDCHRVECDRGRRSRSRRSRRRVLANACRRSIEENQKIMTSARGASLHQGQSPCHGRAQNSRPSLAFYDARAARRSTSWPLQWAGFPIPPGPR